MEMRVTGLGIPTTPTVEMRVRDWSKTSNGDKGEGNEENEL